MSTRRIRSFAAAGFVTSLLLTGCLGGSGSSGAADDSSVIRVQALAGPIIEALEPMAEAYEQANPGVTVQLESVSNDAARQPNIATLTSSNAPDVGFSQIDSGVYQTLRDEGELASVDAVWDNADLENHYPEAAITSLGDAEGERHGVLMFQALAPVVYYNADLFDELDIEVEADRQLSLDEFEGVVQSLDEHGTGGLGVGGNTPYHLHHLAMGMLSGAADEAEYEQYLENWDPAVELNTTYSDGPFMDVVTTMNEWAEAGVFPDGMLSQDYTQAASAFVGGQTGMFLGGSWTPGELYGDLDVPFAVDWFYVPSIDDQVENRLQLFSGDIFLIPEAAGNKEGAADFLEFISTVEQQSTIVETGTLLPIFTTIDESSMSELNAVTSSVLEASNNSSAVQYGPYLPTEIGQEFGVRQYQSMLSGEITPDQVAAEFDSQLENLRAE